MTNTYRLQRLLLLRLETPALEGNNLGRAVRVVGNRRAALGAEPAPDAVARVGLALPLLDGAVGGEFILGDDDDESCWGVSFGYCVDTVFGVLVGL
jgi:hypothetical protein